MKEHPILFMCLGVAVGIALLHTSYLKNPVPPTPLQQAHQIVTKECADWAFGKGYETVPLTMLPTRWNNLHGDETHYYLNGNEEIVESSKTIAALYRVSKLPKNEIHLFNLGPNSAFFYNQKPFDGPLYAITTGGTTIVSQEVLVADNLNTAAGWIEPPTNKVAIR